MLPQKSSRMSMGPRQSLGAPMRKSGVNGLATDMHQMSLSQPEMGRPSMPGRRVSISRYAPTSAT